MIKSDLINALYSEYNITKQEAAAIVNLFLTRCPTSLQTGKGLKLGDCVPFMLKNIMNTPEETQKLGGVLR